MLKEAQTWHYGLVAQWWAEFNLERPEILYFQELIGQYGQPVLDLACGTGRLLLPYLRLGLDVDGCDLSADMLALCREKAAREGFAPTLLQQPMHALQPPRLYRTVVLCGAFGLGGSVENDQEALCRIFQALEPGGALLLDLYLPYQQADEWQYWLVENRSKLPEAWPAPGKRKLAADGSEFELQVRLAAFDPLEQVATRQLRMTLRREGKVVAQEERTLLERLYLKHELLLMLAAAGFRDVQVQGGYKQAEATVEDGILVFIAEK